MAIKLPAGLPGRLSLLKGGIKVFDAANDRGPSSPALRIALLNLMPEKEVTEQQFARLLGESSRSVELTLFLPDGYVSRKVDPAYIANFYQTWSDVRDQRFDGLIVTGAPLESLPFEGVTYWNGLTRIFDWAQRRIKNRLYISWGAQAALYHRHGVAKQPLATKAFGVYPQRVKGNSPLLAGLEGGFSVPVSRHTEVRTASVARIQGLEILAESPETGLCLLQGADGADVYMFNNLEYHAERLKEEYLRDRRAGKDTALPAGYFPGDDPALAPENCWHYAARRFFDNWLGELTPNEDIEVLRRTMADWLMAGQQAGPVVHRACGEYLVLAADRDATIPRLLSALAALDLSPDKVRVLQRLQGSALFLLRVRRGSDALCRAVPREFLKVPAVERVAYLTGQGMGGILLTGGSQSPRAATK